MYYSLLMCFFFCAQKEDGSRTWAVNTCLGSLLELSTVIESRYFCWKPPGPWGSPQLLFSLAWHQFSPWVNPLCKQSALPSSHVPETIFSTVYFADSLHEDMSASVSTPQKILLGFVTWVHMGLAWSLHRFARVRGVCTQLAEKRCVLSNWSSVARGLYSYSCLTQFSLAVLPFCTWQTSIFCKGCFLPTQECIC